MPPNPRSPGSGNPSGCESVCVAHAPGWMEHLAALPLCAPEDVIGTRNLMVIAPHPDDESLGCAGLLAWAAANGRQVRVVMLTDGERSHPGSTKFPPSRLARIRRNEALDAGARLGLPHDNYSFLHLLDGSLDSLAPTEAEVVAQTLRAWIRALAPVVVCATAPSDMHGDHRAAHALALAATRGAGDCTLLTYPVWSWLAPAVALLPSGRRIDIARYRGAKQRAIQAHASQLGQLIDDSTDPFELPAALLDCVDRNYEVLLDEPV